MWRFRIAVNTTETRCLVNAHATPEMHMHNGISQMRKQQRDASTAPVSMHVAEHLRGQAAVLLAQPALVRFAADHEQLEAVQDLPYFLQKPGLMRRSPHLVLIGDGAVQARQSPGSPLRGALLVHESKPLGVPTGAFAVSDRSGRGVVLGRPEERLELALHATRYLMRSGGCLVMLTIQCEASPEAATELVRRTGFRSATWTMRTRMSPSYLQLHPTYDATLASLGQKTRFNLRYYRRRAEQDLRCRFDADVALSADDLIAFNASSMFPQPEPVMRWRLKLQTQLRDPFLMGLRDGEGNWLSLVGGRCFGTSTEILWQMNRSGMQRQSLVSAMRSYLLEHEIARGAERLYIEGGTPHSMQNSFQSEPVTDLVFMRPGLRWAVSQFARRYVPPDNILADMLRDPATHWQTC